MNSRPHVRSIRDDRALSVDPPFAVQLWEHRTARGWSQEELAERAGLSARGIRALEQGERTRPQQHTVRLLADALGLAGGEREHFERAARRTEQQEPPVLTPLPARRARLPLPFPVDPTPFIGREREVREVSDLVRRPEVRLVTLTGPGGTGKTRLARQVAHALEAALEDGVYFVPLAPLTDPSLVPSAIAQVLGIPEEAGRPLRHSLQSWLGDQRVLLVLDNYEHLLEAALVAGEMVAACPHLTILVTSRSVLHLAAEHVYPVPPLSLPDPQQMPELVMLTQVDAIALFAERARAAWAGFALTAENAEAVVGICRHLDGLPLAIELAASRARLLPPIALLARLERRLPLLTGGARDVPERQQTLRATIGWSYDLLREGEQQLFARLAVFAGGCTLEAVETVCEPEGALGGAVLEGIQVLLDQSLLQRVGEDEPRFVMLETIREFAAEMLQEQEEEDALRTRHALYFLDLAERAAGTWGSPEQSEWFDRLEREHENCRAALRRFLDRAEAEPAGRLAWALWRFWYIRGYFGEWRTWLNATLAHAASMDTLTRARVLRAGGNMAMTLGDLNEGQRLHEESLALYRHTSDLAGIGSGLSNLGICANERGEYDEACRLYQEALVVFERMPAGPTRAQGMASALCNLGHVFKMQGEPNRAREAYESALAVTQAVGDLENIVAVRLSLGLLLLDTEEYERAAEELKESVRLNRQVGDLRILRETLIGLADLAVLTSQSRRAARLFGAAAAIRARIGSGEDPDLSDSGVSFQCLCRVEPDAMVEAAWKELWEEGRAMTTAEAIAYALEEYVL